MTAVVRLVPISREWLPAYGEALAAGWSPQTTRDVSAEQLAALRRDPEAFLDSLLHGTTVTLPDGRAVPRLPSRDFLVVDGEFCGRIGLRFQPGTEALPPHVSGHVGYSIVPWKQRRGYAGEALRLLLPHARAEGFTRLLVTCDDDNEGSKGVIRRNGGVLDHAIPHETRPGRSKLAYWVPVPPA